MLSQLTLVPPVLRCNRVFATELKIVPDLTLVGVWVMKYTMFPTHARALISAFDWYKKERQQERQSYDWFTPEFLVVSPSHLTAGGTLITSGAFDAALLCDFCYFLKSVGLSGVSLLLGCPLLFPNIISSLLLLN